MNQKFFLRCLVGLMLAVLLAGTVSAAGPSPDVDSFPAKGGTEYEQSVITIPLYGPGDPVNPVEILKLTAFMRLEREAPVRNGLGLRQFEFTIADWELYGYSEFLDAHITFSLSDLPTQPKSLGISLRERSDYPAMIIYNAIYDIYIDGKRVAHNKPGVAFAKNVFEVPPRNITVAFSKPFELPKDERWSNESIDDPCPGCPPPFDGGWGDGTCEDMNQIDPREFEQGLAMAAAIRAGEVSLKKRR